MTTTTSKRTAGTLLIGLALSAGAGACGESDDDKAKPTKVSAAQLQQMLVRAGEEPGFSLDGASWTDRGLQKMASDPEFTRDDIEQLRAAGFVSITTQRIKGARETTVGLSNVQLFATAAGARRWMARELRDSTIKQYLTVGRIRRFDVPGVPGASGWGASPSGMPPVANVLWVQGRCVLTLGNQGRGRLTGPLATGVRAIHQRTKGQCP